MPTHFINVADLVDPDDPEGRTYRQVNATKTHAIPIGSLVELRNGTRAWVVSHNRDCDQTPLYAVSLDRDDTEAHRPGFANPSWRHGLPEYWLTVILRPEQVQPSED